MREKERERERRRREAGRETETERETGRNLSGCCGFPVIRVFSVVGATLVPQKRLPPLAARSRRPVLPLLRGKVAADADADALDM